MVDLALVLGLMFRWLHILAAATAIGGTMFARFALVPSLDELPDAERAKLHEAIRARWSKVVAAAILFLLVSGFYNFFVIVQKYQVPKPSYHILFGIKFLLALAIFFLSSVLSGRSSLAQRLRQRAKFWLSLNLTLAILVVIISGGMRALDHTPKAPPPPAVVMAQ